MAWKRITLHTMSDISTAYEVAETFFNTTGKSPYYQDVYWFLSWVKSEPSNVHLYGNFLNGDICGIAGGIVKIAEYVLASERAFDYTRSGLDF